MRSDGAHGDERDLPNFRFQSDLVATAANSLRAHQRAALAEFDLADLEDPNVGLDQKGQHVSRLLASPSTGLEEHVRLLEKLQAHLRANPDDAASSFLLERVVLAAYESDQKVWLLAHLLSPQSVSTNHQRDTIKVIQRLVTEFSSEAVVGVLRLLLSQQRRGAVKTMVHKMILRTLAGLRTASAGDVLLDEWQLAFLPANSGRLHADVVAELLIHARRAVLSTDGGAEANEASEALWTILESASGAPMPGFAPNPASFLPLRTRLEVLSV